MHYKLEYTNFYAPVLVLLVFCPSLWKMYKSCYVGEKPTWASINTHSQARLNLTANAFKSFFFIPFTEDVLLIDKAKDARTLVTAEEWICSPKPLFSVGCYSFTFNVFFKTLWNVLTPLPKTGPAKIDPRPWNAGTEPSLAIAELDF